jgi:Flp pilus assembly protein protease CpaA
MVEVLILAAAAGLLLRICWTDFFSLKIRNRDLLILLGLVIFYLAWAQPQGLPLRIGFAAILFGLGFVFWLLGKLGAGDVKLFGVVGCLVPPDRLLPFTAMILVFSLSIYLLPMGVAFTRFLPIASQRLEELRQLRRIPYGAAISLATIAVVAQVILAGS